MVPAHARIISAGQGIFITWGPSRLEQMLDEAAVQRLHVWRIIGDSRRARTKSFSGVDEIVCANIADKWIVELSYISTL